MLNILEQILMQIFSLLSPFFVLQKKTSRDFASALPFLCFLIMKEVTICPRHSYRGKQTIYYINFTEEKERKK